jgi:hypothetical protein
MRDLTWTLKFDSARLPKIPDMAKCWLQIKVEQPDANTIIMKGADHVMEVAFWDLFYYARRHIGEIEAAKMFNLPTP